MNDTKLKKAMGKGLNAILFAGVITSAVRLGMELKDIYNQCTDGGSRFQPDDGGDCANDGKGCCEMCALTPGEIVIALAEASDDAESVIGDAIETLVDYAEEKHMASIIDFDADDSDGEGMRCEFDPSHECCAFGCHAFDGDANAADDLGPDEQALADGQEEA